MLILSDGEDVRALLPSDERIRLIHLDRAATIGEKRNVGCEHAHGEIIVHWDDDDTSEPKRVEFQVQRLLANRYFAVSGFHSMRFVDERGEWWEYRGAMNYALGTSLCYWRDWWQAHRFVEKQIGEDNDFVREAYRAGKLLTEHAGALMHATIHSGNTSRRALGSNWRKVSP